MFKPILLYLILFLHLAGIFFRWYWIIPNYDSALHFLGGFWVAMMTLYLIERIYGEEVLRWAPVLKFFLLIGGAMFIGLLWEGYEFLADTFILRRHFIQESMADTMGDLLADFLGAVVYGVFNIKKTVRLED